MMPMTIQLRSTLILLKYVNCLERVLFVDNKWMKDYEDLSNSVDREYKGVSLYLKKILGSFSEEKINLFIKLPEKDAIKLFKNDLECIVLESIKPSRYIPDEEREKSLVVVACPLVERVFHFKAICNDNITLHKGVLKRFFYHPQLSRIKILSRNFIESPEKSDLKSLKFLYFLPSDANKVNSSMKEREGNFYLENIVPDPATGVSIGSLSNYFVMPLKVTQILRDEENLHQILLKCSDWEGNVFDFHITVNLFRDILKTYPDDKTTPFFIRGLVFQEFCESFRSILHLEQISESEFLDDSFVAYINFRKKISKKDVSRIPRMIPNEVYENGDYFTYKPNDFNSEDMQALHDFFNHKMVFPSSLRKFQRYFGFHPELKAFEEIAVSSNLIPIVVNRHVPTGLHRNILKEFPLEKLKFYCLHKNVILFCLHCKSYKSEIELINCPDKCPNCGACVLTQLIDPNDENLFKGVIDKSNKKIEKYEKLASLFLYYRRYALFVLATGIFGIKNVQLILHRMGRTGNDQVFFEKLLKIKQDFMNKKDLTTILYRV